MIKLQNEAYKLRVLSTLPKETSQKLAYIAILVDGDMDHLAGLINGLIRSHGWGHKVDLGGLEKQGREWLTFFLFPEMKLRGDGRPLCLIHSRSRAKIHDNCSGFQNWLVSDI